MNLKEIKAAVDAGKVVCYNNIGYVVERGGPTGLVVYCKINGAYIMSLNEKNTSRGEFFILENP